MSKPKLRIGMVGYGFMGRTHTNAFLTAPKFFDLPYAPELTAICARSKDRAEAFASNWGYSSVETDWRALSERDDIDVIDIAAPNDTHLEIAMAAAKAGKETAKEISLRITVDGRVAVYGVQFKTGATAILPGSEDTLKAISEMMAKLPKLKIAVVGHTDNVGNHQDNMDLSKRRADAVVAELVKKYGIDNSRLLAAGAGFLAPISSNETEKGRALNRRVELVRVP